MVDNNSKLIKVLIVEDEVLVALDLKEELEGFGYLVIGVAASGEEALKLARTHRPNVALLDIVIKGKMDGIEVASVLVRYDIPVIFITAYSDKETLQRAAHATPYGYLTKPYQSREVQAAIEVACYKAGMERRLRESEQWFSSALRCVSDGVIATEPDTSIRFINPAAQNLIDSLSVDVIGKKLGDVLQFSALPSGERPELALTRALRENCAIDMKSYQQLLKKDGVRVFIDESAAPIRDEEGETLGAVCVLRDVGVRIHQEEALRKSEKKFRDIFDLSPLSMALISYAGQFLQVNKALCKLLGYSSEALLAINYESLSLHEDISVENAFLTELLAERMPVVYFEKRYRHKNQTSLIWTRVNVSRLEEDNQSVCYLFQIFDITKSKEAEVHLSRLAYFDQLTGLPNRAYLHTELEKRLIEACRYKFRLAVIFIDLDGFKHINDSLGHAAGDNLLKGIALRLSLILRESDFIGRLGGDEFLLILSHVNDLSFIDRIARNLCKAVAEPIILEGHEVFVTASLGLSLYPEDGQDAQTLIRCADMALYDSKAAGRNRSSFFRPELGKVAMARLEMEIALRKAIELSQFKVEYQPIVNLSDFKISGFEALLRWNSPSGLLAPPAFFPLAESLGLVQSIGQWVLNEACHAAIAWPEHCTLSVNCSALQFLEQNFVAEISQALSDSGLTSDRLTLELTEDILLKGDNAQIKTFAALRELGVRLSIDDYGTGYSSLAYIKRYNPKILKIDQMFVKDLETEPDSAAIVSATIAMAHEMGMTLIAEGVETQEQVRTLRLMGCDQVQGFLFSASVCASEATELALKSIKSPIRERDVYAF